jgi:cytochrome c oxidase subunit 2
VASSCIGPKEANMHTRGSAILTAGILLFVALLSAQAQESRQITVMAKRYEFTPSRIELKAGQPVAIAFESEDTTHGFSCRDLHLDKVVFSKDKPQTVTFTPQQPGTYEFKCAKVCGIHHGRMKGEIVVTP